ncbi:hypothetical protein PQU92_05790 [Asticcacaulis sp. BYS171W]|uniref:DUF11 domain-containing protein n=1 Tax=Asticcacaulis aquaticus TaxID=2984212 RepID=A0ABT5HS63_9CAUL|nr:hypothetical protein [Asticcacaulis aquaticus]MDC7682778.1 hypothetical protein [Asticcacaulis aquaticus]
MKRLFLLLFGLLCLPLNANAAALTIAKSSLLMSDPLNGITSPKAIPGAVVDYTVKITNPNGIFTTVTPVAITDALPPRTKFYVGALGSLSLNSVNLVTTGPVAFYDDNLLGLGLLGSDLSYTYGGLSSGTDSIAFSNDNGATWGYTPTADADGYDANITNIRVTLSGTFRAGSNFSLRYRIMIK